MRAVALIAVVTLMAAGQVLFKLAASHVGSIGLDLGTAKRLLINPYLLSGAAVYGLTTILWVLLLVDGSLSRSYPFVALTMVLVPVAGIVFFGEPFDLKVVVATVLIIAGLAVLAYA